MLSKSVEETQLYFNEILNQVETGQEIVVTRYGQPIARISAIKKMLKPVPSLANLRATLPFSKTPSVELMRQLRNEGY
ncbi:type II toxin-antitoxin system prevent-host-death family antitoxin [Candidatus Parabeggiatoa sp. HSG14]|uniref:type II toxin-antitoxin system Phd/YefM family antitoxin n=1 Tax=Candidatus Parabeggiatoa sp. HSG14 TaxID=3055593 RepID=UPI0025A90EEB|nr:type II toxin-antitoxin system prevent-host-death family antitoxin [Thiotrichales bacterium HSG14]